MLIALVVAITLQTILCESSAYRFPDDSLTARPYSSFVFLRIYGMSL
jgi:hypothetical protein